ncbi:MAG: hypothetical protein IPM32_05105 [Ignavibacteriae bacterium]|nr:hypothetical protein [Ignavibacteriota bacterium]
MTSKIARIVLFFSILLLLTFLSCSEDPSSPKEEKPKDAVTVGVNGGTLESGDCKIVIPSGALDKDYEISISDVESDGAFGENTVSDLYEIVGLPNEINKPLKIIFKYTGELSEEKFIAIGSEYYNEVYNSTSTIYNLHEAIDSSGFIISHIPLDNSGILWKNTNSNKLLVDNSKMFINILNQYKTYKTEHFKISYPIIQTQKMQELANNLEAVYDIMVNDLEYLIYKNLEIPVVIRYQKETANYSISFQGYSLEDNYKIEYSFNISRDDVNLNNFEKIKTNFFNAFFDLEINVRYDNIKNKQWNQNDYHWIRFAFYSWAEKYLTTNTYSYNFANNNFAPFNGVQYGASSDNAIYMNHGYGMASLIEYLEKNTSFGKNGFRNTYKNISTEIDPLTSMFKNVDGLFVEWFSDYYKKLINNEIYELPKNNFINSVNSIWNINNANDTLKIFNAQDPKVDTYLDLSAKLFKIKLNYKPVDETYKMRLSVKGPVDQFGLYFHVFGIQNNELTFIESVAGIYYYEIPNLRNSYDEFLVCVVNSNGSSPYTDESDIDLKIQIGNNFNGGGSEPNLDYNYCEYMLFVNRFYKREDGSTFEQETIISHSVKGEMIGNRFIAKQEISAFADTLELTLNETGDTINSLNWKSWYRTESPSSTHITEIETFNVPIFNSGEKIFRVSGIQTCASIGHYSFYQDFQGNETIMESFSCNENSYLEIQLSKRE